MRRARIEQGRGRMGEEFPAGCGCGLAKREAWMDHP